MKRANAGVFRQIGILFQRDFEIFINDKKRVGITFLLPVVIGLVITIVINKDDMGKLYESTRATLFTIICAGIYVGMFNSLPLICKERKIIKREYMTGMKISSYIIAMSLFQAIISFVQAEIFLLIFWKLPGIGLSGDPDIAGNMFFNYTITLFLVMFASDMIGLFISAIVKSNELANLIAPIIIIFQLVMSGVLFSLKGISSRIAAITVSKWGMQAMGSLAGLYGMKTAGKRTLDDDPDVDDLMSTYEDMHDGEAFQWPGKITKPDGMSAYDGGIDSVHHSWIIMISMVIILMILCILFLRRVEKDSR